jgi:hypothetical protein
MKKVTILLLLLSCSFIVPAQKVLTIDFDQIKKQIEDPQSPMFYPALMARFEKGDSLSAEELKHVYYGSAFLPGYDPYNASSPESFVKLYQEKRFGEAIPIGLKELARDPVNLKLTFRMLVCYNQTKNNDSAMLFARRHIGLMDAIYNSGEGTSEDKAMVVLRVSDEYEILRDAGLELKSQSLLQSEYGPTDRMELSQEKGKTAVEALYFNVTMPMMQMSKMLEGKIKLSDSDKKNKK